MRKKDVQKLRHGLYILFWEPSCGGGCSVASVGSDSKGNRWAAPANWITVSESFDNWSMVERVESVSVMPPPQPQRRDRRWINATAA